MPGALADNRSRRPTLRARLTLAFALASALPLVLVLPLALRFAAASYEERARSEIDAAQAHAAAQIDALPSSTRGALEQLLSDERVRGVLGDPPLLLRLIQSEQPHRRVGLDEVFIVDAEGRYLVNSLQYGNTGGAAPDALLDYERALRQPVRRREVTPEGATQRLVLASLDVGGVRFVGARALDERFLDALRESHPMTYLLAASVEPPFEDALQARADPSPFPTSASPDEQRRIFPRYLSRQVSVPLDRGERLSLLILRSKSDLTRARRNLVSLFLALFALALVVSGATGYVLSQRITSPVDRLVSALAEVAGGNLDVRLQTTEGPDEIARMAEAFNRMAADLRDGKLKLLRAERIAAWEEIARRLAHEIKNPLSPIRLAIENCRKAYERRLPEFDEIFTEASQAVLEEVEKLGRIVEEFSRFARLPKPTFTTQDLNEVVRGALKLHGGLAERVPIHADLDPELPSFAFDADQIHRVLTNLVQNAIDASPEGQAVRVVTRRGDGVAVISVMDRGRGIEPDVKEKLFLPYVTTKAHGTGLGLAISARIVEEHGGSVEAASAEPGTTFTVTLPLRVGG